MLTINVHVVGYTYVDFTDKKSGECICGTIVWLLQDDKNYTGKHPVKVFFKDLHVNPPLGDCLADCNIAANGRLQYEKFYEKGGRSS